MNFNLSTQRKSLRWQGWYADLWLQLSHTSETRPIWRSVSPALSAIQREHWACTRQIQYSMPALRS